MLTENIHHDYTSEYARKYIEGTLHSDYTVNKNTVIARLANELNLSDVWDFGGNVSGVLKMPGSLRFQLGEVGIAYSSIDLVPEYFNGQFAKSLGVDQSNIYQEVEGIVGDIQLLPLAGNSLNAIVSADVIEHVPNPLLAFTEIYRVLKPGGVAILVLPSLYKLDAVHASHVEMKRYSSHESKLTFCDWIEMTVAAGLTPDLDVSRPLGILSGLLYLIWLDDRFVPNKKDQLSEESFSAESMLFREIKKSFSSLDSLLDKKFLESPEFLNEILSQIQLGRITQSLATLREFVASDLGEELLEKFDQIIQIFSKGSMAQGALNSLQNLASKKDTLFLGNSVILIVRK